VSRSPSPRTFAAFLVAGVLVGLLSIGAGLLVGPAAPDLAVATECTPASLELQRQGTSQIRLTAPFDRVALVEIDFLAPEGDILWPRRIQLAAGTTAMIEMPLGQPVSTIQVLTSIPVQVEATLVYEDSAEESPERQALSCRPIAHPVRGGGPEPLPGAPSVDFEGTRHKVD
jgi:hypothetical protein